MNARYQEGKEPTVIAEELGMKPLTVRQRLLRLRQALRECIENKLSEMPGES